MTVPMTNSPPSEKLIRSRNFKRKSVENYQFLAAPVNISRSSSHSSPSLESAEVKSNDSSYFGAASTTHPLSRSKSVDKRDVSINPPLPRFGHSIVAKQVQVIRPALQSSKSFSIKTIAEHEGEGPRERIIRCRNRKVLMNPPSFHSLHQIAEIEHKFVKTKPLFSSKRQLIRQGEMIKDTGKLKFMRKFYLFTDVLVYGAILPETKALSTGKELNKQIMVSLGNLWVEEVDDDPFSLWMTTEKEHFRITMLTTKDKHSWLADIRSTVNTFRTLSRSNSTLRRKVQSDGSLSLNVTSFLKSLTIPTSPVVNSIKSWSLSRKLSSASVESHESGSSSVSWVPDHEAEFCMVCCSTKFTLLVRRHHCRSCGFVICHKCSRTKFTAKSKVRCCSRCFEKDLLNEEDECPLSLALFDSSVKLPHHIEVNSHIPVMSKSEFTKTQETTHNFPTCLRPSSGPTSDSGSDGTFGSVVSSSAALLSYHPHHSSPLNPSYQPSLSEQVSYS